MLNFFATIYEATETEQENNDDKSLGRKTGHQQIVADYEFT